MPTHQAFLKSWADALLASSGAPAFAVAVAKPGGEVWSSASGIADMELGSPAHDGHLFRIGSVSKIITATAAARLAVRGMLDLQAPISDYLPGLSQHHRQTTLRQLLTHRGGVRHYTGKDLAPDQPGGPIFNRTRWSDQDILTAFIDDDLVAVPGTRVSYSSWGYSLASLVMAAAAGRPFLELIDHEVVRVFDLPTLCPDRPAQLIAGRVRGYVPASERKMMLAQFPDAALEAADEGWTNAPPINPAYCWAGAGYLASMPDIARFGAALIEGPTSLLTAAERTVLFTPVTEKTDASPPLGLGWRIDHDSSGRLRWHHAGATPGGRAVLVVYPAEGLSIALGSNCMTLPGDVLGPAAQLADLFTA
ncbi:serine hydrolase domain-containing protein [Tsuneonella sp. HG222]